MKEELRKELERLTKEFLKNGGKIEKEPRGDYKPQRFLKTPYVKRMKLG